MASQEFRFGFDLLAKHAIDLLDLHEFPRSGIDPMLVAPHEDLFKFEVGEILDEMALDEKRINAVRTHEVVAL